MLKVVLPPTLDGQIADPTSREGFGLHDVSSADILNKSILLGAQLSPALDFAVSRRRRQHAGGKLNDLVLALRLRPWCGVNLLQKGRCRRSRGRRRCRSRSARVGHTDSTPGVRHICSIEPMSRRPESAARTISRQVDQIKEMSASAARAGCRRSPTSRCGARRSWCRYGRCSIAAQPLDVLPPSSNITVSNVPGPRQNALCRAVAELLQHLPGFVDLATGVRSTSRAELSRPARFRLQFTSRRQSIDFPWVQLCADILQAEFDRAGGVPFAAVSQCQVRGGSEYD